MASRTVFVAVAIAACATPPRVSALSCLNERGATVPWWLIMKAHGGLDYSYVDASFSGDGGPLRLSGKSLDCGEGCALGATLTSLIGNPGAARITWNDEPPSAALESSANVSASALSATSGHTKGVMGADSSGGFWLTHSMPKFPLLVGVSSYSWAAGGASDTYGQSFLCVSLAPAEVEVAAAGLKYVDPLVYGSVVPAGLAAMYPTLTALLAGARTAGAGAHTIRSTANNIFTHYGKSGSWGKDIYEDLIQDALGVDMFVETWRRAPAMETYCRPSYAHDSFNVATLHFTDAAGGDAEYKYTQDHSKVALAVNATSQQHWVCVGDNNRMTSQWSRGGGSVCFRHAATYAALSAMVLTVDPCP